MKLLILATILSALTCALLMYWRAQTLNNSLERKMVSGSSMLCNVGTKCRVLIWNDWSDYCDFYEQMCSWISCLLSFCGSCTFGFVIFRSAWPKGSLAECKHLSSVYISKIILITMQSYIVYLKQEISYIFYFYFYSCGCCNIAISQSGLNKVCLSLKCHEI